MKQRILILIIVLAAGGGGLFAWKKTRAPSVEAQYRTVEAGMGDVVQTVSANGTLNPVILVNVGTQVSGTVKKLYADFNGHVKAGQILARLDPALFQAQVSQSEANLANARASLDLASANEARSKTLYGQAYISRQDYDTAIQARRSAEAQVALAKAQLFRDRTNLGYSVIKSPVSGVIIDRQIDVGQTVAASFQTPTLFRIAQDLRNMQIDSSFAEADIGNLRVGQAVHFSVDAFPGRAFDGKVSQIRLNATIQQNVVTYDVVVSVDNPELILKPGMTAYVNIVVAQRRNVLIVPNAAFRFTPGKAAGRQAGKTVYVIRQSRLVAVPVQAGISDNKMTAILGGGLKPGDRVVTGLAGPAGETSSGTLRMRML